MYNSTLLGWDFATGQAYTDFYFNSKYDRDCSVVCITYTAANKFCKWLTETYLVNPNRKYKQVLFRLPTKAPFVKVVVPKYDHRCKKKSSCR
jgi:hypothetical protein